MRSSKWPRFVEELDEEIGHSNDWSIYQEARSHYEAAMREYSWWSYYQKYGMLYPNTSSPRYPYLPRPQHSSMLNQPLRQSNHRLVWCIPVRSQPTFYADSTAPLSHHLNLQEAQNRAPWQARQALSRASMQAREALSRASMQARVARSRAALLTHEARSRASMQALFESLMCDPSRLAECQKELGNAQFKMKQYGKALPYYTEAIKLCPENANYYGNRAACYLMQGQFTKALEDANKSVSIDPKFVKGWLRIAKCTMAQGDLTTAEAALNKAKELEPSGAVLQAELNNFNDLRTYIDNSEKAYNSGDYRMVVYCMDRALNMATSCSRYKVLKAECLAHLGNYQDAQELANEVLAFDKQNADAILVRGMCLYYQDNVDMAFTHFQHVLKLAPDHRRALDIYKKAKALKQKKEEGNEAYKAERYQDAYRLYSEALTIDPKNFANNAKIYFNRALVLSKLKKVEESVADCSEALKLNPSYLKALLKRAEIHTELAQYEEAVQDYEKAAKMDRSRETMKLLNEAKLALKKSQRKDYYKILGVAKNASTEEIKRAYKKRALVHHPDRHANASEGEKKEQEKKFKEVGEAYGVLSNPQKRAKYDNGQSLEDFGGFSEGPEAYAFHTFFDAQFFAQGYPGAFSYQCS